MPGVILVVEDEAIVREFVVLMLDEAGYEVLTARNGDEALRHIEARPDITLLFTDIKLPGGLNGFTLAKEAARRRPDLKILYATGYGQPPSSAETELPQARFIAKPYRPDELEAAIASLIQSPQQGASGT